MFYQLTPVGNPIELSHTDQLDAPDALVPFIGSAYQPYYYTSGTAALAAAIMAAIQFKAIDNPEVILPAYGCPDLISAIVFAGAEPVLVDLEADRPWMNLEQVSEKISSQTVAIIAVNLFGISERLVQLRPLAEQAGVLLIEDSAQSFPMSVSSVGDDDIWQGDLIVLSFGRGKPVSLLGGGAVLRNKETSMGSELGSLLPEGAAQVEANRQKQIAFWLKAQLYNWMIDPRVFWLPQSLPFLHLGETHYHPLTSLEGMDQVKLLKLASNVTAYQCGSMTTQNKLSEMLGELESGESGITDLSKLCKSTKERRLLRYPLLVEKALRDSLCTRLQRHGLGVSRMYPAALPEINGLEKILQPGEFPQARSFAKRLLTLPTHGQVRQADINKLRQLMSG